MTEIVYAYIQMYIFLCLLRNVINIYRYRRQWIELERKKKQRVIDESTYIVDLIFRL